MDLVWKDHKSVGPSFGRESSNTDIFSPPISHVQTPTLYADRNSLKRTLKFVQGRPKAKRRPRERRSNPATFSVATNLTFDGKNGVHDESSPGGEQADGDAFIIDAQTPCGVESFSAADTNAFGTLLAAVGLTSAHDFDMDQLGPHAIEMTTNSSSDSIEGTALMGDEVPADGLVLYTNNNAANFQRRIDSCGPYFDRLPVNMLREPTIPSTVLFENQAQKFEQVLALYNEEFCVLPLSMDCHSNPFRVSLKQCEAYPFLLHSVLALSFQHLAKQRKSPDLIDETDRHRSTAVQLYSQALGHSSSNLLLDTLLLLFNFEVTQSAFSGWKVHLRGAEKILAGMDVPGVLRRNSRMRAQVATLVWWDITLAFISRKESRMPLRYLEMLIEHNHKDEWTFFALNGCPAELMTAMGKLARLATIYEKAAKLEWTTFNTRPVDAISDDVLNFENDEDVSFEEIIDADDDPNSRQDRLHCVEAWRLAILLYVRRVFQKEQDARGLRVIDHLTRVILDHIRSIRPAATVQKQVLLPLFLAAAELGIDDPNRSFVRSYCRHWSATARYSQFESALSWLETIWMDWMPSTRCTYWWGCKVGGEDWGREEGGYPSIGPELLLG